MRRNSEHTRIHRINRLLYSELREEYEENRLKWRGTHRSRSEIKNNIKAKKCIDWLKKNDLPEDSAMGLFAYDKKIPKIKESLSRWTGNSDNEIKHYLTNVGLCLFDEIRDYDEFDYETCRVILEWKEVDWNGKRRL